MFGFSFGFTGLGAKPSATRATTQGQTCLDLSSEQHASSASQQPFGAAPTTTTTSATTDGEATEAGAATAPARAQTATARLALAMMLGTTMLSTVDEVLR